MMIMHCFDVFEEQFLLSQYYNFLATENLYEEVVFQCNIL